MTAWKACSLLFLLLPWISISDTIVDIRDYFVSPILAQELGQLSRLVYQLVTNNAATFENNIPSYYKQIGWIDSGSTEVLVVEKCDDSVGFVPKGTLIVTFRGTEEPEDWIVDADQVKVPFGFPDHSKGIPIMYIPLGEGKLEATSVEVHRGFNGMFRIYNDLVALLHPAANNYTNSLNTRAVYVTGHSLGGANAALFSTMFAFHNPLIQIHTVTFGAPRCGNKAFKIFAESLINLNLFRFVNRDDVVPRVPFDGYNHVGHLIWRNSSSKSYNAVEAYYRQIGNCKKKLKGIIDFSFTVVKNTIRGEDKAALFANHLMTGNNSYIEWLDAAVASPDANFTSDFMRDDEAC